MNIEYQKQVADKVLALIELHDPYCIVAGGAPRDWYFGKEASDIDLFFYSPVTTLSAVQNCLEKILGQQISFVGDGGRVDESYRFNPKIRRVFETVVDGVKVQFIQTTEPTFESVLDYFPFSVCKAWYKHGTISYTEDFKFSVETGYVVCYEHLYANGNRYTDKIKSKFPEKVFKSNKALAEEIIQWVSKTYNNTYSLPVFGLKLTFDKG